MVAIRLTRMGAKKRPYYRIVVVDSRQPRDGAYLECVGYYHPIEEPAKLELDGERINFHVKNGASVSATVKALCKQKGVALSNA